MNPSQVHIISPKELEEILLHFSQSMTDIDSEEELLWDLVGNCISKLNFEDAVVYLLDASGEYLEQKAAFGPKSGTGQQLINPIRISVEQGLTGRVYRTGLPILASDTRDFPEYLEDDQFRLSEVAVPILLEGKVIGVIDSENSTLGFFTEQHVRILNAVASIYSGQIARIRAEKKVQEEQQKLLEMQKRNYRFQLDALSAQLSPHFVFNSLNSIQNQIFKEDKESSIRFLSIFSKLLRYFLNQLKVEAADLPAEIQMIQWYLEIQKLRYGQVMEYQVIPITSTTLQTAKIPSLVVQNLIENLLEEQIQLANGAIAIRIEFSELDEAILMKVQINQTHAKPGGEKRTVGNPLTPDWEGFVGLLNEIRPYQIRFIKGENTCDSGVGTCKFVNLILPNLTSR